MKEQAFDCVFLDYRLGATTGLDVLQQIREAGNDVPIIAFSGEGSENIAVAAMKLGAQDYIAKSAISPEALERGLGSAIQQVALRRALDDRQRELESFVHVASHDLQAPLRQIISFSQLVQEEIAEDTNEDVRLYLDRIQAGGKRMRQLIDRLLEYARTDGSGFQSEVVDLNDVLAIVLENLDHDILEADVTLTSGPLPVVTGDRMRLVQLFQNLVANAIKFYVGASPRISIQAERKTDTWQISVEDNGIGVEAEFVNTIFEPFQRLYCRTEFDGSGIGLATCRRIVEQHGGRIWVESEIGKGSTFTFTIPAETDDAPGR